MQTSFEGIKSIFDYHTDGYLIRKSSGERAGTNVSNGYRAVRIGGKLWFEHRLIYLYHYGCLPEICDHIDRDNTNNKIENLRSVNYSLNRANAGPNKNSFSGYKGVSYDKVTRKYRTHLKGKHVGLFESAKEAAMIYNIEAYKAYGNYAFLNKVFDDVGSTT